MEKLFILLFEGLCVILTALGQVGEDTGYQWIKSEDPSLVWSGSPSPEHATRLEGVYLVTQCAYHCIEQSTYCTSYQYHQNDYTCTMLSDKTNAADNSTINDNIRIFDKDYLTIDLVSIILNYSFQL